MSRGTVISEQRQQGWNIHFLQGPAGYRFAGVFQPPGNGTLTYKDVIDEFRLCFDLPQKSSDTDPWKTVAFGHHSFSNIDKESSPPIPSPPFVYGSGLEITLPSPPALPRTREKRPVSSFMVVEHQTCNISADKTLEVHMTAGCAKHIPARPTLHTDLRYLPINKPSRYDAKKDRTTKRKRDQPDTKKKVGRVLGRPQISHEEDDGTSSIASAENGGFRSKCLTRSIACAVSGDGGSWFASPCYGPGLQAGHIIPRAHYSVFPTDVEITKENRFDRCRLEEAWRRTTSTHNGLVMMSHLHQLFNLRLFSIHPITKKVRVFMPYDVILRYHGKEVEIIREEFTISAMKQHYEMCCIENMAASHPLEEPHFPLPHDDITISEKDFSSVIESTQPGDSPSDRDPDIAKEPFSLKPLTSGSKELQDQHHPANDFETFTDTGGTLVSSSSSRISPPERASKYPLDDTGEVKIHILLHEFCENQSRCCDRIRQLGCINRNDLVEGWLKTADQGYGTNLF